MNSEEQYKNIEQKIIEAASRNEYAYSEEAWKRMELLLEKKDKKRRFFFWLLPLLLLVTIGGGMAIYNNFGSKKNIATIQKVEIKSSSTSTPESTSPFEATKKLMVEKELDNIPVEKNKVESKEKKQIDAIPPQNIVQQPDFLAQQNFKNTTKLKSSNLSAQQKNKKSKNKKSDNIGEEEFYNENKISFNTNKKAKVKIAAPGLVEDAAPSTDKGDKKNDISKVEESNINENKPSIGDKDKNIPEEKNNKEEVIAKTKENKKPKKQQPNFFVTASLGAETNTTQLLSFNNTTLVPRYGGAIGYQFNNRLSVQAGFFVSGKKYIAKGKEYKFDANSYWNYVDMVKVDANCKVYEIPLSLQYNFITKQKINVFATAGVSSYIMKKEAYIYDYWYNNTFYTSAHDYTKNTHALAVANFSLGIEKTISKKMVLQLAPRISIPLSGVGEGSVKLFSSGIDFGVKYYPFKK